MGTRAAYLPGGAIRKLTFRCRAQGTGRALVGFSPEHSQGTDMSNQDEIFARLIADHDKHRALLAQLAETGDDEAERYRLLEAFTKEAKAHAAAEEQALYSTMMRKPETTDETRHSVAEHHEVEEMLNDLAATDMSSDAWLEKFKELRHRYEHHIDEEEEEHFPDFADHLTDENREHMKRVFERRKKEECAEAEVTPEKMEDAKS